MPYAVGTTQDGLEYLTEYHPDGFIKYAEVALTATSVATITEFTTDATGFTRFVAYAEAEIGASEIGIICTGTDGAASHFYCSGVLANGSRINFGVRLDRKALAPAPAWLDTIAVSGGQAGDKFVIVGFRATASFTTLGFPRNLQLSEGDTYRSVPKDYDPQNHTKRIRSAGNTVSFDNAKETGAGGVMALAGARDFTVISRKDTDGDGTIVAAQILLGVSGKVSQTNPLQAGGEVTANFAGAYNQAIELDSDLTE